MKKHFKIPALAVLVILNIAAVLIYVVGIKMINARAEKSDGLNEDLMVAQQRELTLHKLSRVLSENTAYAKKIDGYFVSADGAVALIERLESIGKIAGADLKIVTVGVSPLSGGILFETIEIRFNADGEWKNLLRLMKLIETEPLAIELTAAHLDKEADEQTISKGSEGKSKVWHGSFVAKAIKLVKQI